MMGKEKYTICLSNYEADWVEQAKDRDEKGLRLDEGTLQTLGQLLIDNLEI